MSEKLDRKDIKKIFPKRLEESHKGDNGRMIIVGGSIDFYGAPILSALGALYSGCDLIYLFVPECNFEVTRSIYPDFIVRKFPGEYLNEQAIPEILEMSEKCQSILIGPGISGNESALNTTSELVKRLKIPTVLDSEAIQIIKGVDKLLFNQPILITPHQHEFSKLAGTEFKDEEEKLVYLKNMARRYNVNAVLKGRFDFICSPNQELYINETGNAGMTVGGSGDVLSGLITGFMAQNLSPISASILGTYILGSAGDNLFAQKYYCYSATDLALEIPYTINELMK